MDDSEVPVSAWQWLNTSNFRKKVPTGCDSREWNALVLATDYAALLAEHNALLARVEAGTVYGDWQVGDETLKTHVNIGINVWRGERWLSFHQASPAEFTASLDACRKTTEVRQLQIDAAIDAARQPAEKGPT